MNFSDISHHNPDPINWDAYAAVRDRIVLKASQGRSFVDNKFVERWGKIKGGRLAYHYLEPDNKGSVDFDHFIDVVRGAGLKSTDWLILDTEKTTIANQPHPRARQASIEFVNRAVTLGFTRGIIYSYRFYLDFSNIVASDFPAGWRMLWLADYTRGQADSDIEVPPGWNRSQIIARQYNDQVKVPGLTGLVDDSRVLNEWMNKQTKPPVGDWWDTVDQATAQATMEKAIKNVFNIENEVKFPFGQSNNDNFIVNLTTGEQTGFNSDNMIKAVIQAIKEDTALQGDDEQKILDKLEEVKNIITQATPSIP